MGAILPNLACIWWLKWSTLRTIGAFTVRPSAWHEAQTAAGGRLLSAAFVLFAMV